MSEIKNLWGEGEVTRWLVRRQAKNMSLLGTTERWHWIWVNGPAGMFCREFMLTNTLDQIFGAICCAVIVWLPYTKQESISRIQTMTNKQCGLCSRGYAHKCVHFYAILTHCDILQHYEQIPRLPLMYKTRGNYTKGSSIIKGEYMNPLPHETWQPLCTSH